MPYNFWIIIIVQFIIFTSFYFHNRGSMKTLPKVLLLSAIAGLIGGFLFDVIFGTLGLFSYHSSVTKESFYSTGLLLKQLIFNGIFSYGLAVATAKYLTPPLQGSNGSEVKKGTALLLTLVILLSLILSFVLDFGIGALFIYGTGILALGELVLVLNRQEGPLLSLFLTRKYSSFIRLWADIVLVGFLYEVVNMFFPFWTWLPHFDYSHVSIKFLVTVFGYVVLFHPMMVFWQRLEK
jgi:hypothetical protein